MLKKYILSYLLTIILFLLTSAHNAHAQQPRWISGIGEPQQPMSPTGFYNITELNVGFGLSEIDRDMAEFFTGITSVAGYRFNKSIWTGLGTGVTFYNGGVVIPVFLDNRLYLGFGRARPFLVANAGFMMPVAKEDNNIRTFIDPGFGFHIPMAARTSISTSIGLISQFGDTGRDSFLNARIGLIFH